jgi:hypothetical protein
MQARALLFAAALVCPALSQTLCQPTPIYSQCEIIFELEEPDRAKHPNPYLTVELHGEFRSPRHRTHLLHAFWDGGSRMILRFAPTDAGEWELRLTSNIARWNNRLERISAVAADVPGFIEPANGHHWRYTENRKAHLWMGDTSYTFASIAPDVFAKVAETRAAQKFTHLRGMAVQFKTADQPDYAFYSALDERVAYLNQNGLIVDMILGGDENYLAKMFPTWQQRERYLRYVTARYSAFNVTWQLTQEFEEYENGRELLKEMGTALRKLDPYGHPRTTHTVATSAPLLGDGWMNHVLYQSSDDQLGAIEHQLYGVPFVNSEFAYEDSGAGKSHPHHVDSDTFRRRLWNAFMNGQYPTFGNTGTYGGRKFSVDAKYLESPGAKFMTVWWDLISTTRYWELEPYFDLDGGRAMALPGTEYIIYVEKPSGPIEIRLEKHNYDVKWVNPLTGEAIVQKNFNSDKYTAEPPSRDHDWILHVSREGRKEGMLRSYKFESRPFLMQEVESSVPKIPYEIALPASDEISIAKPPLLSAKLKRETRGTRSMMYLWIGDVPAQTHGYRVIGTGSEATMRIPAAFTRKLPATMSVRLYGLNANGKLYSLDRIYRLIP